MGRFDNISERLEKCIAALDEMHSGSSTDASMKTIHLRNQSPDGAKPGHAKGVDSAVGGVTEERSGLQKLAADHKLVLNEVRKSHALLDSIMDSIESSKPDLSPV